jgi:hypothetical protein
MIDIIRVFFNFYSFSDPYFCVMINIDNEFHIFKVDVMF